jgi:hypothetical protein
MSNMSKRKARQLENVDENGDVDLSRQSKIVSTLNDRTNNSSLNKSSNALNQDITNKITQSNSQIPNALLEKRKKISGTFNDLSQLDDFRKSQVIKKK